MRIMIIFRILSLITTLGFSRHESPFPTEAEQRLNRGTSDGGVLLPREVDRKLHLTDRIVNHLVVGRQVRPMDPVFLLSEHFCCLPSPGNLTRELMR